MRLIRQLEMVRRNLTSELRDLQWKVDQESKVYHQLNELCRIYKLEIQNAKSSIPRRKPSIEEEKFAFQRLISVPVKRI